jgi:DnaJ like chaperone protein
MSIWGKVLGAATGSALRGPPGALVGAAVGHYIKKYKSHGTSGASSKACEG